MLKRLLAAALVSLLVMPGVADAKRLRFSGYDFKIKDGPAMGPGPNDWDHSNAFVDGKGRLHLRLSEKNGKWYAAEIESISRFGFGTYQIEFTGDIGRWDKDVVFGFFNFPTADVGPDGTNEIDVEFARWGDNSYKPLNYTVWPARQGMTYTSKAFEFRKGERLSVHRFIWSRDRVAYTSVEIRDNGQPGADVGWTFAPKDYQRRISSSPMPVHFNLWGFKGRPPSDREPVEVIVNSFKFTPAE